MTFNLYQYGEQLDNVLRPDTSAHEVTLTRDTVTSEVFSASSPPIGHVLLTETGLELTQHERYFFWQTIATPELGLPKQGDIVTDQADGSKWKVLPLQTGEAAWRWHGQLRTMIQVKTLMENFPVSFDSFNSSFDGGFQ